MQEKKSTLTHQYQGLTPSQVEESRRLHGSNVLTPAAAEPWWKLLLEKFRDPMIVILLVAGVLSVGVSIYEYISLGEGIKVFFEPIGIFVAIILATGLGFFFEERANKEFEILNQVNDEEPVDVIRSGSPTRILKSEVVVGDILIIGTGQEIPADARLLESKSLQVDESSLTGEPMAHKSADPDDADPEATFPTDLVLRGTKVMEGHGIAEVTAVGDATENGKVFEAVRIDDGVKTPLSEQLDRLGKLIAYIGYTVGAVVVIGRLIMYFVELGNAPFEWIHFIAYLLQTIMIAVTLLVVSVPEGLPMAVTLSLAYSMRRMLKTNNLVRKLHACETMGAATVICTDKTGTLTQNRMSVADAVTGDVDMTFLAQAIACNTTARLDRTTANDSTANDGEEGKYAVVGNPTEGALLLWIDSMGYDYEDLRRRFAVIEELPFTTERKYMATEVKRLSDSRCFTFVKGAPEIVAAMCTDMAPGLTKEKINEILADWQARAMRTLALAYADITDGNNGEGILGTKLDPNTHLTLMGIVAIADPVRTDVPEAMSQVKNAGIDVKIVTGDTPGTAREIGRQIGLITDANGPEAVTTGVEFEQMTDDQLLERLSDLKIIARARPMDKKRLVELLQSRGDVVAVTGDGTNDAPALKAAHVGLSMGDGTSVAKEASDITIIDNSFASIGRAVLWGRSLYSNIQRFILFQTIANVVASLTVLAGSFMGTQSPLTVTQMLWVNLLMDTFAAMALASLPPTPSLMNNQPRDRHSFIITGSMWRMILSTGITFFAILFAMIYVFEHSDVQSLTDLLHLHLSTESTGLSATELTYIFTTFVMLLFWDMFNVRAFATGHSSALHLKNCGEFLLILSVIFIGQILIVNFGGNFFNVTPISFVDWLIITGLTSLVLWIGELLRLISHR